MKVLDRVSAILDLNRVIKIVESVNCKSQLDCALNCFLLWESKYKSIKLSKKERELIKKDFWIQFETKAKEVQMI